MAASENVMISAPPIVECAGAERHRHATEPVPGEEVGTTVARAEPGCGARWASAARPGGPAGGKAEPGMGCPVVVAPSAQAQKLAESSASFRPRSSREGFLGEEEEEAFSATFLLPRGLAVMGNHVGTFRRGFFRILGSFCSLGCLELSVVLLLQHCQVLGSQAWTHDTQPQTSFLVAVRRSGNRGGGANLIRSPVRRVLLLSVLADSLMTPTCL